MTHILRPKVQSEDGVERGGGDLGVGHCDGERESPRIFQEERSTIVFNDCTGRDEEGRKEDEMRAVKAGRANFAVIDKH